MESLGRMVAMILAVILLFLFPLRYDALMEKETVESYIHQEMEHFLYQITNRKYVNVTMYENFARLISATGDLYTVEIERYTPTYYAEEGGNSVTYENVREQLKNQDKVIFEEGDYLVLSIKKTSDSFYDQLMNLFLPIYPLKHEVIMGGGI